MQDHKGGGRRAASLRQFAIRESRASSCSDCGVATLGFSVRIHGFPRAIGERARLPRARVGAIGTALNSPAMPSPTRVNGSAEPASKREPGSGDGALSATGR